MSPVHPHHRSHQLIRSFEAHMLSRRSMAHKIADSLTDKFGSIAFLCINAAFFLMWIILNHSILPQSHVFDPYPFIFLTTFVSLQAILLTVIVLISHNRKSQIETIRNELLLQVELIAEKETSKMLFLMKQLLEKNGVSVNDEELEEMIKEVDTSYIERKLEEQLSPR